MSLLDDELASLASVDIDDRPYVPIAVAERYARPERTIRSETELGWLRRLAPIVANHRVTFTISLLTGLVALVLQVASPRVVMAAIDGPLRNGSTSSHSISFYVWVLVGLAVGRGVFGIINRVLLFYVAYGIENDLRVLMYERLSYQSFGFYDRVQSGQLISRANSDIRSVQMFLTFAPNLAISGFTFVMAFALMLTVSVPMSIVAIATMPIVAVMGIRMRQRIFPASWLVQERTAHVAMTVEENVSGVRVVKSFAGEAGQASLLAQRAQGLRWAGIQQALIRAKFAPAMEAMPRIGMGMVLLMGGWLAIDGKASAGTIVAFSAYVVLLQAPFRMLGQILMMSQRASASALRIFEVLDAPIEIVDRPGAYDLVSPAGAIDFDDVTFSYGQGARVLDGFSLHVEPGQTIAIVGRTGCGKTTLSRVLARFYDVDSGAIRVDGHDVRDLTLSSLRAHVGMVFDEPFLFSLSIRDNIAYARPDAPIGQIIAAAKAANAHEFIEHLEYGYDTVVGERGYDLSGGQRQRIAIARTLLANPKILVLDDATSAIDVHIEQEIHQALERLMRSRTTLIIAHRLSTIALADRVVLVGDGEVLADGTHEELMASEPRYGATLAGYVHDGEDLDSDPPEGSPATEEGGL